MGYYDQALEHHGIKGQKWGVRRYQNKDGSLTQAGKRRLQNDDGSLKDAAEKHIRKNMWNEGLFGENSYRGKLANRINSELQNTKEAKEYNDLIKRRGIVVKDRNGNVVSTKLSYMGDDWSNPEKVMDDMVKDMQIEKAYHAKDVEITNKYFREYSGALLKDLGYEDTEKGRDFLIKKGIMNKYE